MIAQSADSFEDINQRVYKHLTDRDWDNLPPRGLATSIALEANELLEHYQWSDKPVGGKEDLASELADILIFCFEYAQVTDIDMAEAIKTKLAKTAEKYPAEHFKGKTEGEKRSAWLHAKQQHREKKKGL